MGGRLTKGAFMALIEDDIAWLMQQPDTLERAHIKACLDWATKLHYPERDAHAAGYADGKAIGRSEGHTEGREAERAAIVEWHQEERKRLLAQAEEQKSGGWRHQESYLRDRAQQHADIIKRLQSSAHVGGGDVARVLAEMLGEVK